MKLEIKDIEDLAILARLDLTKEEKNRYAEQLSVIFDYFESLREVDTESVEETCQVTGLTNITREDIPQEVSEDTRQKLRNCFPQKQGALLKVKAVFKQD